MDYRGSKLVICENIAVKEQRADGSSTLGTVHNLML